MESKQTSSNVWNYFTKFKDGKMAKYSLSLKCMWLVFEKVVCLEKELLLMCLHDG